MVCTTGKGQPVPSDHDLMGVFPGLSTGHYQVVSPLLQEKRVLPSAHFSNRTLGVSCHSSASPSTETCICKSEQECFQKGRCLRCSGSKKLVLIGKLPFYSASNKSLYLHPPFFYLPLIQKEIALLNKCTVP